MDAPASQKHPFWKVIETAATERSPQVKALAAAILLMSTRGDIFLDNEAGEAEACSGMTMERIFDALVRTHDRNLMPKPQR